MTEDAETDRTERRLDRRMFVRTTALAAAAVMLGLAASTGDAEAARTGPLRRSIGRAADADVRDRLPQPYDRVVRRSPGAAGADCDPADRRGRGRRRGIDRDPGDRTSLDRTDPRPRAPRCQGR